MSVVIKTKECGSFEEALKKFKRMCSMAGILSETRKREYYDKPSVKRKKKSAEAARKKKSKPKY